MGRATGVNSAWVPRTRVSATASRSITLEARELAGGVVTVGAVESTVALGAGSASR